jgi:sec-independent protein translocase protein TatC
MSFLQHIAEFRQRLLVCAVAVTLTGAVGYYFSLKLLKILTIPAGKTQLVYLSPLEPFMVKFKIAVFSGIVMSLPLLLYEILMFVAPALKDREKKLIMPSIFFLVILFLSGAVFGFYYIMPAGTQWLLNQAGGVIKANISASMYVTYAGWFLMGMGVSFETPLFILLMVRLGVITPEQLAKSWRYAVLMILLLAAILTPDWNPVTMIVMAIPMLIFYVGSIPLSRLIRPKPKTLED